MRYADVMEAAESGQLRVHSPSVLAFEGSSSIFAPERVLIEPGLPPGEYVVMRCRDSSCEWAFVDEATREAHSVETGHGLVAGVCHHAVYPGWKFCGRCGEVPWLVACEECGHSAGGMRGRYVVHEERADGYLWCRECNVEEATGPCL